MNFPQGNKESKLNNPSTNYVFYPIIFSRRYNNWIGVLLWSIFSFIYAIPWPISPVDSVHPLGNNWCNFQDYGSTGPYFHTGIDIITPNQQGAAVYAVAHGWVKAWLTLGGDLYWRLAIADSNLSYTDSCEAWLYAHIDPTRYHKNVGDEVYPGDLIGYLVPWTVPGFDHLHFARIKDQGSTWITPDWAFVRNPLCLLSPNIDTVAPTFENALSNNRFAFCQNNKSIYLNPDSLYGNVDIIAKIYDRIGKSTGNLIWDKLAPFRIEYAIRGISSSVPTTHFVQFSGRISQNNIRVVYKQDSICRSRGDYVYRDYYFIVTNTNGDTILEPVDSMASWQTTNFPDGAYYVKVTAYDIAGNAKTESMLVRVKNHISGIAQPEIQNQYIQLSTKPNPARSLLNINFTLKQDTKVNLLIYNNLGQLTQELYNNQLFKGNHNFIYYPKQSGVYFVVLKLMNQTISKKFVVSK
ncbi:MAG: T9SS type A sorting domain-containing protein [candidate division WOR-3 bacterium]|nr:T9SS type A sorting domain-containing protein [candidate division WOR-3 bacterium]